MVLSVLYNIEKSIREFGITVATVEWNSAGLSLNAQANAYYLGSIMEVEGRRRCERRVEADDFGWGAKFDECERGSAEFEERIG